LGRRKAQLFTTDLSISFSVVVIVIILTTLLWIYSLERKAIYRSQSELQQISRDVAYTLVDTPGYPESWTDVSTASAIGLSSGNHEIDPVKLAALSSASYDDSLDALGIIGSGYGFHIDVDVYGGSAFTPTYSFGGNSSAANVVVVHQRYALLNHSWTRLTLKVWQ
jgi:hypothetical protein